LVAKVMNLASGDDFRFFSASIGKGSCSAVQFRLTLVRIVRDRGRTGGDCIDDGANAFFAISVI
jgi:hypothetical protein